MPEAGKRRSSRWIRRVALTLAVGVVALLLIVAVAGPTIIAALAPAIVGALGLPGQVELEGVELSWRGELSVERATIYDPSNHHVATVSVSTGGGLLGLLNAHIEDDIRVDGWATIEIAQDDTTNIERALGLERDATEEPDAGEPFDGRLPFNRIVFDGLDASITRTGSQTLAIAGLAGQVEAQTQASGGGLKATATGDLTMPAQRPKDRSEIKNAPPHGSIDLAGEFQFPDLSGSANVRIDRLSAEYATALGALSGDQTIADAAMVAARGGLGLHIDAAMADGLPTDATVTLDSSTVKANLALATRDGVVQMAAPGLVEIDTAAFLAQDTIRQLLLPGQGVAATQAGRLTLDIERVRLPMVDGKPQLAQAQADVGLRLGDTRLTVPGPEGQPVEVRVHNLTANVQADAAAPLSLTASADAGVTGQPDGKIAFDAQLDTGAAADMLAVGATVGVDALARALPSLNVELSGVPTLAARPWLAALDAMGLDVPSVAGDTVSATLAWAKGENQSADVRLSVRSPHVQASADARWTAQAIELTAPATLAIQRPGAIAAAWLPEGWSMQNGQGVQATVARLRLPMNGFTPDLAAATAEAQAQASGASLQAPGVPDLGIQTLRLQIATGPEQTSLELASNPTAGGQPATLNASLRAAGLGALLDRTQGGAPAITGSVTLEAPAELAGVLDTVVAGRPLQQWVGEALGPSVTAQLDLGQPAEGQLLAGTLRVQSQHATLNAEGIGLTTTAATMSGATLTATPSAQLWQGLAPVLKVEGATLAQTSPIVVQVGPAGVAFAEGASIAAGLQNTSITLAARQPIRINGVPTGPPYESGQRPRTDIALTTLAANLNSLGAVLAGGSDANGSLDLVLDAPGQGPVATISGRLQPAAAGTVDLVLLVDQLDTRRASAIGGLSGSAAAAIEGAVGANARVEARASGRPASGEGLPWTLDNASLSLNADRLTTASPIRARFTPDAITLVEPAQITWTPQAAWLESAIGARVESVEPFVISLDRLTLGNPLAGQVALLEPSAVLVDAAVNGKGATIAIKDRPSIELQTIDARVRRIALSTYSITGRAATANGGTLELNGLIDKPTDDQGRLSLETAQVRGTLKGDDVPVALADAMSNTDGLLGDSLGEVVDLDAEIQHGRLVPGQPPQADLRFSVRGPRADASGYGRLADHTITMTDPQTILTVREVRPEIAQRFSQIIPELLMVEKRPEDGPAIVRTQGLSIPTNGDWSKGQGQATVALGTARFRTSSLLSGVLKVAGQRDKGSLGRRIDPINITMVDGVITYEPFDLPLGDLTLHSEGVVNLPANTMDVLVWIPMAALSDEAAGKFNTGLGSAIGRSVPGFGSATTVPWRVSGPLNSPDIRPAPRVLIERRGQQLLGPLLRPGESLQDLLSLPRRRETPDGG